MKKLLCALVVLNLASCVGPEVAAGPRIKAANGMTYTHENMGNGRHFLTVIDTRPGVARMADIYQAMTVFAHRWAAQQFPKGFEIDPNQQMETRGTFGVNPSKSFIITETR